MSEAKDYCGAIHIHTSYSFDGHRNMDEIIESANRCGLDFIVISDHFSLEAKKYEGWYKNTLVIVGEEITPRYNHYLALDIKKAVVTGSDEDKPQKYIDEVAAQGGFGFIAHPDHTGNKKFGVKSYMWKDWSVTGFTGFCIWDLQTDWQETLTGYPKALLSYLFPAYFLKGPKKETLERWDAINQTEKKYILGEIDNHESRRKYFGIKVKVFKFDRAFRMLRTHILLDEPFSNNSDDIKKVYNAFKTGKSFVSNDYFFNARGFEFYEHNGRITAKTPVKAVIRIVKNGKYIAEEFTDNLSLGISEKGVYRCECYLKKFGLKPWIFSNPIFI
ncbi:MAG: PHP domain-containing protein [Elusimicrobia bacterium]|nr:PHP domain-containing protein [Elusimicrobiota bacterium]